MPVPTTLKLQPIHVTLWLIVVLPLAIVTPERATAAREDPMADANMPPFVLGPEPAAVSTFECISLYWKPADGAATNPCGVHYRKQGEGNAWREAQPLWFDTNTGDPQWMDSYRGSIVGLDPGTRYAIRLRLASGRTALLNAATWSEPFPVAKTVRVNGSEEMFITSEGGTENGYVVYDGQGATIDVHDRASYCILIAHDYVIVRNFKLTGASKSGIYAFRQRNLVVEHCDITNWGSLRKPAEAGGGPGWGERGDGGIHIEQCLRAVIQGNTIHHPRHDTNEWYEDGHPDGPTGIFFGPPNGTNPWKEGNHVIRYNHIYSDADHLYEDGIMSRGNFLKSGLPGADSDLYGNIITNCTDDGIEADGGGRNIRLWNNYIAQMYSGISTAAVTIGPLYVFRNVFGTHREMPSKSPKAFKMGDDRTRGIQFVYHNTCLTRSAESAVNGVGSNGVLLATFRNNILLGEDATFEDAESPTNSFDYDLCNESIEETPPGSEEHGFLDVLPRFREGHGPASGPGGRYELAPGSPGFDGGVALPGFNDHGQGAAPDLGAQEAGSAPMPLGPAALADRPF